MSAAMSDLRLPSRPDSATPKQTTAEFSHRDLRNTLGMFATGVSVVTATHGGEKIAATIGSFSSVSLDPPLILFMLAKSSKAYSAWSTVEAFAVNILHRSQAELSSRFARPLSDKWKDVTPRSGNFTDAHLLPGAIAWLECQTHQHYEGGDHLIILGRVLAISHRTDSKVSPLIFFNGRYHSLMPIEMDDIPHQEAMWIHGW